MWCSLAARVLREHEAEGSNPSTLTENAQVAERQLHRAVNATTFWSAQVRVLSCALDHAPDVPMAERRSPKPEATGSIPVRRADRHPALSRVTGRGKRPSMWPIGKARGCNPRSSRFDSCRALSNKMVAVAQRSERWAVNPVRTSSNLVGHPSSTFWAGHANQGSTIGGCRRVGGCAHRVVGGGVP